MSKFIVNKPEQASELYQNSEEAFSDSLKKEITLFTEKVLRMSVVDPVYFPVIERYLKLKNLPEEIKAKLTLYLLRSALKFKDAALVQLLQKYSGLDLEKQVICVEEKIILNQLAQVKDPLFFSSHMLSLTDGFGKITYNEGLVTLAQISKRKESAYAFHPTLLQEDSFLSYLEIIKSAKRPCSEVFIKTGKHWVSGKIRIDEGDNLNVLLIDPTESKDYVVGNILEDMSIAIYDAFPEPYKINLFIDKTRRQHSIYGCSVFALDDVRHLYTASHYLDEKYKSDDNGFFQYLIDKTSPQKITSFSRITGYADSFLPPSMLRTMQSEKLMTTVLPKYSHAERELPLKKMKPGKKPVTINTLLEENKDFVLDPKKGKLQNQRLENFLAKMARYDYTYLLTTPIEQVQKDIRKFTLEGLKERLAPENSLSHSATHKKMITSTIYTSKREELNLSAEIEPLSLRDKFYAAPTLKEIILSDFKNLNVSLGLGVNSLSSVQIIMLRDCILNGEFLENLLQAAPNLYQLTLAQCTILESDFNLLPHSLPRLKYISITLTDNSVMRKASLQELLLAAPNVEIINLWNCSALNEKCVLPAASLSSLQKIAVSKPILSKAALEILLLAAPNLEKITLSYCENIDKAEFKYIKQVLFNENWEEPQFDQLDNLVFFLKNSAGLEQLRKMGLC